jgi:hypothetical protein
MSPQIQSQSHSQLEFSKFPPEIRNIIWKFAADQKRFVELRIINPPITQKQQSGFDFAELRYSSTANCQTASIITIVPSIPPILHACHESRHIGLTVYQKLSLFGYFNLACDILVVSPDIFPYLGWHARSPGRCFPLLDLDEGDMLQHIAFYFPTFSNHAWNAEENAREMYWIIQYLSHLRSVTYLSDLPVNEGFWLNLSSEFIERSGERSIKDYRVRRSYSLNAPQPDLKSEVRPSLRTTQRSLQCCHRAPLYTCRECEHLRRKAFYYRPGFYSPNRHQYTTPNRHCCWKEPF